MRQLVIATRGSALALAQAKSVQKALMEKGVESVLQIVRTKGDRDQTHALRDIGGDGLFVRGIEKKLLQGEADIAVHCGKDLPYRLSEGLVIAGVPEAADPRDCLICRSDAKPEDLKVIGTGSPRRILQLQALLPQARCISIRGNITTRIRRIAEGKVDGLVLAMAGLERLAPDLQGLSVHPFTTDQMLPAACQGILALECRAGDEETAALLAGISDQEALLRFQTEREVFCGMQADCTKAVGVHMSCAGGQMTIEAMFEGRKGKAAGALSQRKELMQRVLRSVYVNDRNPAASGQVIPQESGFVTLVGAGCGKGLLTVKGLQALKKAQVLVYDDLIDDELTGEAPASCERIYAGKRYGKHSMAQEEINSLLVRKALEGRNVVRLKGGDSFVFGRGGEEVLALMEAGIRFEVIPGVSSSIAVPACAGIPVTHRGTARSFTVVTGKTADGTGEDYKALAALQGTLVFLMGLHAYPKITGRLIRYGKDPATPAAVISNGCSDRERRIDGTLADIAERSADAETPAILVVGETAAFRLKDAAADTAARGFAGTAGPLPGSEGEEKAGGGNVKHAVVTGTEHFVDKTVRVLRENGIDAQGMVTVRIQPDPAQIPEDPESFDWLVFTSANGISLFFDTLRERKKDLRVLAGRKIACIGSGTQSRLLEYGLLADLVPAEFTAAGLGEELSRQVKQGERVLILRAEKGSALLTQALDRADCDYEDRKIYRTVPAFSEADPAMGGLTGVDPAMRGLSGMDPAKGSLSGADPAMGGLSGVDPAMESNPGGEADADAPERRFIVFGSASGVETWFASRTLGSRDVPVCIGRYTWQALPPAAAERALIAETYTAEGLADVIKGGA